MRTSSTVILASIIAWLAGVILGQLTLKGPVFPFGAISLICSGILGIIEGIRLRFTESRR